MTLQHILKNSSQSGKEPLAAQLANGEIALNYHADGPFLTCKDTAGVVRRLTGVWVGASAPGSPTPGELWLDISITPNQLKVYKDSTDSWVFAGNVANASTSVVGVVELATNAETQAGSDTQRAVTPASLQSKISDSTVTVSATTIASSSAVKTTYDLANAALPKTGGTVTGALEIGTTGSLSFEGSTANDFETTLAVTDPTADRTITLPDRDGTVITSGDTGTVTSTMLAGTIADSKLSTISSADKISLSALNIDGGTDIGAALADADLIIVDDGGNGTNRKAAVTRLTDYTFAKLSGDISATSAGVTTIKTDLALSGSPTAQTQAAGTNNTTLATTAFVMAAADAARQGLTVKQACRAATTANITLSGTQTIDGVAVVAGDRVLVKSQSTAAENGIYICAASGWTRATDFDADADLLDGAFTFVEEGTANADSGWVLTTNGPITVGVTSLAFVQFSGAGQITAGSGLSKDANTLSVASGGITSDMLADGTIVNSDVSASAAIAGTKISPDFGSQNVTTTGRLLVGTSSARSNFDNSTTSSQFQIEALSNAGSSLSLVHSASTAPAGGSYARVILARNVSGTVGGNSLVSSDHELGAITFQGNDGTEFVEAARIQAVVDGTPGANSMPGRIVLGTTAAGSSSATERMSINSNGTYRLLNNNAVAINQGQNITDINFEGRVWYTVGGSGVMQNIFRPQTVYEPSGSNGTHWCGFDFIRVSPASSGTPGNGNGPQVNMEFRGNTGVRILTGATYGTISDVKVKDNIVDATPKLSDLMQLRVRNFSMKGTPETKFIGFIAQELEKVFPTLVTSSKDYALDEETGELVESDTETKGIKDSALIPILVKSLQEAVARIEALEVEVASLKA